MPFSSLYCPLGILSPPAAVFLGRGPLPSRGPPVRGQWRRNNLLQTSRRRSGQRHRPGAPSRINLARPRLLGDVLSFREKILWFEEGASLALVFKAAHEQHKANPPEPHP